MIKFFFRINGINDEQYKEVTAEELSKLQQKHADYDTCIALDYCEDNKLYFSVVDNEMLSKW